MRNSNLHAAKRGKNDEFYNKQLLLSLLVIFSFGIGFIIGMILYTMS